MKKVLLVLSLFFTSIFANGNIDYQNAMIYKADINSKNAYERQQKGALLIDVRTKREFDTSRAKDSINIPLFKEEAGERVLNRKFLSQINDIVKGDNNKEVILICRSGSRTKLAGNLLAVQGFTNIYNIKNGFQYDWSKINLPIEK